STCGGRTEDAENIFDEKLPYLKSVMCEYQHPEPKPFSSTRQIANWKEAVLAVAGGTNFKELRRFFWMTRAGEPPPANSDAELATWIRENFYPTVKPPSDAEFLTEQGILSSTQSTPQNELLFRLIDKKSAFEWQQGILTSWDGQTVSLLVNNA